MYRIKPEHLNQSIFKGIEEFNLSKDMTQEEILFIKNMVDANLVEEVNQPKAESKKSKKNDTENSEESI